MKREYSITAWSIAGAPYCLAVGGFGSYVLTTRDCIYVYQVTFGTVAPVEAKWISVVPKAIPLSARVNNEMLVEWFQRERSYEVGFQLGRYAVGVAGSILGALLTDGSLRIFQEKTFASSVQDAHEAYQINLNGFLPLVNVSDTISSSMKGSVSSFELVANANGSDYSLVVSIGLSVGVLSVSIGSKEAAHCQFLQWLDLSGAVPSSSVDGVGILSLFASRDGSSDSISFWFGTSAGDCGQLSLSAGSLAVSRVVSLGSSPVSAITMNDGAVLAACNNKLFSMGGSGQPALLASTCYPFSGWAALRGDVLLLSSVDGTLYQWSAAEGLRAAPVSLSRGPSSAGLWGLASDPLGLIVTKVSRRNPAHDNSREVQLNKDLLSSRCVVDWAPSPLIDVPLLNEESVAAVLDGAVKRAAHLATHGSRVSFSSVAVLFDLSLKTVLQSHKGVIQSVDFKTESSRAGSSAAKQSAYDDNSSSSDDDDDEFPSSKKRRKDASRAGSENNQFEELCRSLADGQDASTLVEETLRRVLAAARGIAVRLNSGSDAVHAFSSGPNSADGWDDVLSIASDKAVLANKVLLWQMVLLLIVALHSAYAVAVSPVWTQLVLSIKRSIAVAGAISSLSELVSSGVSPSDASRRRSLSLKITSLADLTRHPQIGSLVNHSRALLAVEGEQCFVCSGAISFESFDSAFCGPCSLRIERCSSSLLVLDSSGGRCRRCPVCKAVALADQASSPLCTYCSVSMHDYL